MSELKVPDASGHTLTLQEVDGHIFPIFPADIIRNVPELRLRDDDILISGYPKSGTHWLWEVSRVLLTKSFDDSGTEKDILMLEQTSADQTDKVSSPRALNTHVPFELLPKDVFRKKLKLLYLIRNPKDSAVSFYNHHKKLIDYYDYHGSFQDYLPLWVDGKVDYGSWFTHIKTYIEGLTKHPEVPSLIVQYEDISKNPLQLIKKISKFLEKSYSDDFYIKVMNWCSFDNMRELKGMREVADDGQPIMYRKGEVGNWKKWFTVAQNEWFDKEFAKRMGDFHINVRYS